jgi:hypothetical protein
MDNTVANRLSEKKRDPVLRYEEYAYYQFAGDGEGVHLRESRQTLADNALDNDSIRELDEIVIEAAIANDYVNPGLLEDELDAPLQNWWWHLGKIRAKTYPAASFSEHLRLIYLDVVKNAILAK